MTLADDCVAYQKLDSDSSPEADATGNGNTMTMNGATFTSSGFINGAYTFDGINDSGDYTTNLGTSGTDNFSINLWMKSTTTGRSMFGFGTTTTTRASINVQISAADKLQCSFFGGNRTWSAANIDDGNYHMITIVFNGTQVQDHIAYMDGSLLSIDSTGTPTGGMAYGDEKYAIGFYKPSVTQFWDGDIDEVGFFNVAITADDVTTLFNGGVGLQFPFEVAADDSLFFGGGM